MSIRNHLLYRSRVQALVGLVVAILIAVFALMAPHIFFSVLIFLVPVVLVGAWAMLYTVRCPRCGVLFDGGLSFRLNSKIKTRRFNYCPGCGVNMDSEVANGT
ncbi:MAG: hypothetical protein V4443_09125 [Pseudomonadota bacterium]